MPWDPASAPPATDALALRVYSSRLLGADPTLVLHGGGNTSVKATVRDLFGEPVDVLYIKGSGADLATIDAHGFAPVRLEVLRKMADLPALSDTDMVKHQRAAMLDPNAPTPSVEAILHAIIPFKFVDHTHADAIVTLSNTPDGEARLRQLYGDRVLFVPYVMPGFALARAVHELTREIDWTKLEGIVLLHHGVFTFADDARTSYERMLALASTAESSLVGSTPKLANAGNYQPRPADLLQLASLRRHVSRVRGVPVLAQPAWGGRAAVFASRSDIAAVSDRGPLTPDHLLRTKRTPLLFTGNAEHAVNAYDLAYRAYFQRHATPHPIVPVLLDPAPRWAVWPGRGTIAFGTSVKESQVISDIAAHTADAIERAEALGGWRALPEADLFAVEYWVLEQAKLARPHAARPLQGKIALVTGAASGIGKACADVLREQGAVVAMLDIAESVTEFAADDTLPIVCDVTDAEAIHAAVDDVIAHFGGLDIVVSNAGIFPPSAPLATLDDATWQRSLDLNATSHFRLLQTCLPFLKQGLDPSVILIASKNVAAPGPGAAAYSAAKSALTQLGRVAALEWGQLGIRVNMIHPNAVFDTALWTPEILSARAKHYGLSVDAYKRNNVLEVEVTSRDVAALACALASPLFAKTTGAQIPVDGGNDRVI
jgi:rhamnose utilization protein RhaD (predicted bifunctional aldolase and dehydrogenase)/NAD(P)-dependent dehydrogenase (short-subunit alcohol dehydrogenase family)